MRFLTFSMAVGIFSSAWAQFQPNDSFLYTGTPLDLENIYCVNQTTKQKLTANALQVCQAALRSSQEIAEGYAQFDGSYLGCVDATNQGMYNGFEERRFQFQNKITKYDSEIFNSALQRGAEKAQSESNAKAVEDVIKIYRNAAMKNSISINEKTPQPQTSDWPGLSDGYENDRLIPNQKDIETYGWVSSADDWSKKLAAGIFYQFHSTYPPKEFCLHNNKASLSLWQYYLHASNSTNYKIKNGAQVLQTFLAYTDAPGRSFYDSIQQLTNIQIIQVPIPQPKPKNPKPGEKIILPTRPQQVEVPISAEEAATFREMFKSILVSSYDQQYKLEKFSAAYLQAAQENYDRATVIGRKIGLEYARKFADARAYNDRYRELSRERYLEALNQNYSKKFKETVEKFENNAILEMLDLTIIGENDDGVLLQGERLSFYYHFNNLGEKETDMLTSVQETQHIKPIVEGTEIVRDEFRIPALTSYEHSTKPIARIADSANAGQHAMVTVSISNGVSSSQQTKGLPGIQTSQEKLIMVNTMARIKRVNVLPVELFANKVHQSRIQLEVYLSNPSTQALETPIKIRAVIEGLEPIETETLLSETNDGTKSISLISNTIDTMKLISGNKTLRGIIETYIGNQKSDTEEIYITVPNDPRINIISYFGNLTRKTLSFDDTDMPDFSAETKMKSKLIMLIDQYVVQDIQSGVTWKKPYSFHNTAIRLIQDEYRSSGASTSLYAQDFKQLGEVLAKHVNKIKGSKNRKVFLAEIKKFAPEISDRPKDY